MYGCTGFPKKDARFSRMKNMSDLLSDGREGKRIKIKISTRNIYGKPCICQQKYPTGCYENPVRQL